jgi:hypothetical protein
MNFSPEKPLRVIVPEPKFDSLQSADLLKEKTKNLRPSHVVAEELYRDQNIQRAFELVRELNDALDQQRVGNLPAVQLPQSVTRDLPPEKPETQ